MHTYLLFNKSTRNNCRRFNFGLQLKKIVYLWEKIPRNPSSYWFLEGQRSTYMTFLEDINLLAQNEALKFKLACFMRI